MFNHDVSGISQATIPFDSLGLGYLSPTTTHADRDSLSSSALGAEDLKILMGSLEQLNSYTNGVARGYSSQLELKGIGYNARIIKRPSRSFGQQSSPNSGNCNKHVQGKVTAASQRGVRVTRKGRLENMAQELRPRRRSRRGLCSDSSSEAGTGSGSVVQEESALILDLGWSRNLAYTIPERYTQIICAGAGGADNAASSTKILIRGISKFKVHSVAADIHAYRKPEPYGGKGIRRDGEKYFPKEDKDKKGGAGA